MYKEKEKRYKMFNLFKSKKVKISREEYERLLTLDSKDQERRERRKENTKAQKPKEFLYVGHYVDIDGNYILKVGTTNNLERRRKEHTRNYHKTPNHPMPLEDEFLYDWSIKLSKYNTLRFEDETKAKWIAEEIGEYIRNDRFVCKEKPESVNIFIRKNYEIIL